MNRIAMLCPYFGHLITSQFKLWLKSCAANSTIDFFIFTDDICIKKLALPNNVRYCMMSWAECQALVRAKVGIFESISRSYKLCDYRPAFGLIFAEYISNYDFWGYGDNGDTIWGDLRKFITDDTLDSYDKIGIYGHFTLMRNTEENNHRFQIESHHGMPLSDVFSREETTCFDEMWHPHSINTIFRENNFPLYEPHSNFIADIHPRYYRFYLCGQQFNEDALIPRIFEWKNGTLLCHSVINGTIQTTEYGYIHFQKRPMQDETTSNCSAFYIVPNKFVDVKDTLTVEDILFYTKNKLYFVPIKARINRFYWYLQHPQALKRKLGALKS